MNNITKNILVLFGVLFLNQIGLAQSPSIAQLFSVPNYLSPAFAGIQKENDLTILYRNQWPNSPVKYEFNSVNLNFHFEEFQSGLNLNFYSDKQANFIETLHLGAQYSYQLTINESTQLASGIGLNGRFINFNNNNLLTPNQISFIANNASIQVNDPVSFLSQSIQYTNLSAGILFLNPNYWLGISFQNLGNPNLNLSDASARLNKTQYSLQAGINKPIDHDRAIIPFLNYTYWGDRHQYQIGTYFETNPFILGFWLNRTDFISNFIGYRHQNYTFGYSYDINLNSLNGYTGGHELMLKIRFKSKNFILNTEKQKNRRAIACPRF